MVTSSNLTNCLGDFEIFQIIQIALSLHFVFDKKWGGGINCDADVIMVI